MFREAKTHEDISECTPYRMKGKERERFKITHMVKCSTRNFVTRASVIIQFVEHSKHDLEGEGTDDV